MNYSAKKLFTNFTGAVGLTAMALGTLPLSTALAQSVAPATSISSSMDAETVTLIEFAISQGQRDFAVVSKANARLYLIENGRVTFDVPVGLGEDKNFISFQGMERRKATPEGRFGVRIANDENALSISGMPVIDFVCTRDMAFCMSMHATYLAEFNARQARINTPTVADNFFSNGCINVRPDDMRPVLNFFSSRRAGNNEHVHPYLYIMPTDITRTRELFDIPSSFMAQNSQNLGNLSP